MQFSLFRRAIKRENRTTDQPAPQGGCPRLIDLPWSTGARLFSGAALMCYALRCRLCGDWVDELMSERWPGDDNRERSTCLSCDPKQKEKDDDLRE